MKKILGLDLGTNSIGWAVVCSEFDDAGNEKLVGLSSAGSRIIPMDAAILSDYEKGNSKSQTAERTRLRGMRRLLERHLLRRERLYRVLSVMGFLPPHFASQLNRYGKFSTDKEPKLAWRKGDDGTYHFLFQDSFQEMLAEFKSSQPGLLERGKKIPYDWTLYYLRKKALSKKVSKEELAWILLSFNQKRGYYQLRVEEAENDDKKEVRYYALRVVDVEDSGDRKGKDTIWYNVHLENGWIYRRASNQPLDWVGKVKEFVVTTEFDAEGNPKKDKDGKVKRSFRSPNEEDWRLVKIKTQEQIDESGKTVGSYIYDTLLSSPSQKIRGELVHTIDRKYYKEELIKILNKQQEFYAELRDSSLLEACVDELYPMNESHRNVLLNQGFIHFLVEDILFYQRPLKSKKSLIDDCPYESRVYKKDGILCRAPLKCVSKSHPLFQEFRLWQFVANLRIYQREKMVNGSLRTDVDVTSDFLKEEKDYVALFEWLNERKSIEQKAFLAYKPLGLNKKTQQEYRWNYVEDKSYPCNETRSEIVSRLKKAEVDVNILTSQKEEELWHILYSVSDKQEIVKALQTFADKNGLGKEFTEAFAKMPPFKSDYAAYSLKAIKKLLPLMRMGKYWNEQAIDANTVARIDKMLTGECDESIQLKLRDIGFNLGDITFFRGLPLWLACYIVYDRHSEAADVIRWENPEAIDLFLKKFKQHSLRNPIVEQVVTETLRTVRDIWKQEGKIDEIHIELGRDMKNPSDVRKKLAAQALKNEKTNLRIKALLLAFMNPEFEIEDVRPYSPMQQDILRIYEDTVVGSEEMSDDIADIFKRFAETDVKKRPTRSEILRYKLWLDQCYRSPYTGKPIPLGKLFTPAYQIEHIIPQKRYFDDSFNNKVICEAAVNRLKGACLGYEFIKEKHGQIVDLGGGEKATIFSVEQYEKFVKDNYVDSPIKKKNLLLEDIPESFIERQLNDSRYISKVVKSLLSNVVREEGEREAISKNVIVCTGGVTDRLKKDWGIVDVWNRIILPRFERLNELTDSEAYTAKSSNGHVIPVMPLDQQRGFNKKRIDHRHHAMDAIVIACASRNIVNYLNNASASGKASISRFDLQHLLCDKCKTDGEGNYKWILRKPWKTFTEDVYQALLDVVVSFKQNLRVINSTSNHYLHYNESGKKVVLTQNKGDSWAIRKPMHKDTVFGEINLRKIKTISLKEALNHPVRIVDKALKKQLMLLLKNGYDYKAIIHYFDLHKEEWAGLNTKKIETYYFTKETKERFFATRKLLDISFSEKKIREEVADTGIQKILLNHLLRNENKSELAFSPDGIERMNANLAELNGGKFHQPIYKVRVYEKADKFAIGERGSKKYKFVEAAKGTNLFFAIYELEEINKKTGAVERKRTYATIPLNVVIERQKQGLPSAPEDENGNLPKYVLSPNDLVYLPTKEELQTGNVALSVDRNRIYKMVSCTGNQCFFVQASVANVILNKQEFSSMNKMERALTGEMIKETCILLKADRLGNISFV